MYKGLTPSVALKTSDSLWLPEDEAQRVNSTREVTCCRTDLEPNRRMMEQIMKTFVAKNTGLPKA